MINLLKLNFNANQMKIQWLKSKWWWRRRNLQHPKTSRCAAVKTFFYVKGWRLDNSDFDEILSI